MPIKYSKLSDYQIKKIVKCFCSDIDATKTAEILDFNRKTINRYFKVIRGRVSLESVLFTDGWRGYSGLLDVGYEKHFRIDKSKSFSNQNGVHINGIESFWSFTKRRLAKFNGVKSTFNFHLKECEWRWRKEPKELWELLKKYG